MGLTALGCRVRRERLLSGAEADLFVITDPRHIFYLTGLYVTPLALSGWGLNFLLIEAETGRSTLLIHNFIAPDAHEAHVDNVEMWRWYDISFNPGIALFPEAVKELNQRLRQIAPKRVAVEVGHFPFGAVVEEVVDVTEVLLDMRRVKYPDELQMIREAIRAIEAGQRAARAAVRPGVSELDVYNAVYTAIVQEAGHAVAPYGDFASGERKGGPATQRVMKAGELMIVDLFPVVNGYRADFTATIAVDGTVTQTQKQLETALHAGIAAGESMLKPDSRAGDVYQAVADAIAEHGFGEGFWHHAGHGFGLGHPEAPYFVPNSDEILRAGEVVTLEPGSYGEDYGARIEHNYLITADGFERLTAHDTSFTGTDLAG